MECFIIKLEHQKFYSRIGVFEQERKIGNEFIVDVEVKLDASSFVEENLASSLSYAGVYDLVASRMKEEALLLETVAKRIATDILALSPSRILNVIVAITKETAPISGCTGPCRVEYHLDPSR